MDETTTPLPRTADGTIETSASFGMSTTAIVRVTYNTDVDGAWVDEDDHSNQTFHGPFADLDEAQAWMEAYPDDTDVKDMDAITLNAVRPPGTSTRTVTEWGFMHPGYPHVGTGPHIQTSYTGHDGWTTGPYTEENVASHANGCDVYKRTRTITEDVVGEWEKVTS